jgi:hypothetical protein
MRHKDTKKKRETCTQRLKGARFEILHSMKDSSKTPVEGAHTSGGPCAYAACGCSCCDFDKPLCEGMNIRAIYNPGKNTVISFTLDEYTHLQSHMQNQGIFTLKWSICVYDTIGQAIKSATCILSGSPRFIPRKPSLFAWTALASS